jgi:phosphoribosylformylglycinamidine cyclo-ligase
MDYKKSGVDIDAGNATVARIKGLAKSTFTPGVLSSIGSFGGLFRLGEGYRDPVLVSSADGVGTKLKVAFLSGRHGTVGQCLVNHCVNDILVQGAVPLFFLDYLATGKLLPDVAASVIEGMATACRKNGCALIGGETAEMPGFYQADEYDLAGFIVGVVERDQLITGARLAPGDALIGLRSTGLHTNGYSLARSIFFDKLGMGVESMIGDLGCTVGDELLRVHRSYLPVIRPLLDAGVVKALAHITGGGITENLPRVLPPGTAALIDKSAWTPSPVFRYMGTFGGVPEDDMYRTFNMGIGFIIGCAAADVSRVTSMLQTAGETRVTVIGRVVTGEPGVVYGSL